jgi:hypothetical protein
MNPGAAGGVVTMDETLRRPEEPEDPAALGEPAVPAAAELSIGR